MLTRESFVVRDESGGALGRFSLSDPLGPVPDAFAYVWPTRADAEAVARAFPNARVGVVMLTRRQYRERLASRADVVAGSRELARIADERARVAAGCTPSEWHALKRCGSVAR